MTATPKHQKRADPTGLSHSHGDPILNIVNKTSMSISSRKRPSIPITFPIVFAQSILLFVLYYCLFEEYSSNVAMQRWLASYGSIGGLIFSSGALLIIAVTLAVIIVESLPGRTFSR